jgi:hypothetical protein
MAIAHFENISTLPNGKSWLAAITSLAVGSLFLLSGFGFFRSGSVSAWNWSAAHAGAGSL